MIFGKLIHALKTVLGNALGKRVVGDFGQAFNLDFSWKRRK